MAKDGLLILACAAVIVLLGPSLGRAGPGDDSLSDTLAVQSAMQQAREHLLRIRPQEAVIVLHRELGHINFTSIPSTTFDDDKKLAFLEVDVDDVFLGNGVSELVSMAVQALLEDGDEILIDIPNRTITLLVSDDELTQRRAAMLTRGAAAWSPRARKRQVSRALRAYAALARSASHGAVRDPSLVEGPARDPA